LGVSNVGGLIAPKRILGNVCCMVPDSLKGATDEDEVQVTGHIFRVCSGPGHRLFTDIGRERVQLLIAGLERLCQSAIAFGKGSDAIAKDCQCLPIGRFKQRHFAYQRPEIQTLRSSGNGNGVGMACGFLNGFIVSFWNIPSFIVTLGMLNVARGAALEVTDARTLFEFPNEFNAFGTATLFGAPAIFVVALALVVIGWIVLTRTVFGRMVYAIGNNEEAVRLSGHNTFFYKVAVFAISGLTVGIGAIIYMARLTIASPILGSGFELNAIAAVIIGGTSLNGGRGSLIGTFLGACLIGVLADGLILMGVGDFVRQMITGGVIILAVIVDSYRARFAERTR